MTEMVELGDVGSFGHVRHSVDGLANDLSQLHGTEGEWLLATLNALQIEDVVDEADEAIGVGQGDAEQVGGLFVDSAKYA
jgi:hypothetical protein